MPYVTALTTRSGVPEKARCAYAALLFFWGGGGYCEEVTTNLILLPASSCRQRMHPIHV